MNKTIPVIQSDRYVWYLHQRAKDGLMPVVCRANGHVNWRTIEDMGPVLNVHFVPLEELPTEGHPDQNQPCTEAFEKLTVEIGTIGADAANQIARLCAQLNVPCTLTKDRLPPQQPDWK